MRDLQIQWILTAEPNPEAKAASIIDSLPGNSLVSKTTWVTLGAGATAFAVSNELYVANEETVILAGFVIFVSLLSRVISQPYTNWANSYIEVSREDDPTYARKWLVSSTMHARSTLRLCSTAWLL